MHPRLVLALVVGLLSAADSVAAQQTRRARRPAARRVTPPPRNDAARADRIEQSLLPATRVAGRDYAPSTIAQRMRELNVPAVSVAVIDSGQIVWARAYGMRDVESQEPATPRTMFQAASMSKPIASTMALLLVQDGTLSLDKPVNARLLGWTLAENAFTAARPVTLRHLLTHTGGVTVHGFAGYARGRPVPTTIQVLEGASPANSRPVRVDTTPGAIWRYSGGGMTVMQQLIGDVTGEEFAPLLRQRVLEPLQMTSSTFEQPLPDSRANDAATGYRPDGSAVPGRYHTYPEMAAAGLWTTPSDLARWIIDVQRSLRGEKGRLLAPAMAHAMVTRGLGGWGLGVSVEGARDSLRFSHGGANEGFRGQFVGYVTRGSGVVVMTNSDAGMPLVREIAIAVAKEYGLPGITPRVIMPVALGDEDRTALLGSYRSRGGVTGEIVLANESLWLSRSGSAQRWELIPIANDRLEAVDGPIVQIERDNQRRVRALVIGGDRFERTRR